MAANVVTAFRRNTFELLESIEDCLAKRRHLPCLILLFSGIDALSALECEPGKGTRAHFIVWVDKYMLNQGPLRCSGQELYAARCGVLHSFTADSDLYRAGKVRRVFYAWGTANPERLNTLSSVLGLNENVCIHVQELIEAFREGIAAYLHEVTSDPVREGNFIRGAGMWFVDMEPQKVDGFLLHLDKSS